MWDAENVKMFAYFGPDWHNNESQPISHLDLCTILEALRSEKPYIGFSVLLLPWIFSS